MIRAHQAKQRMGMKLFIACYVLLLCAFMVTAIVSHSGGEVLVTYRNGQIIDAQTAFSSLWNDVYGNATILSNNCQLVNQLNGFTINSASVPQKLDTIPGTPGQFSQDASQITLVIGGVSTTAQGAVADIAHALSEINTRYVKYACHMYCNGNTLVPQGTCDGQGGCGAGYSNPDLTNWCQYGCNVQYDNVNPATGGCKQQPADTCAGNTAQHNYLCTTNDPSSCGYQSTEDCGAAGKTCQNGQCVAPAPVNPTYPPVGLGQSCNTNPAQGPGCTAPNFCYDGPDPDTVGVCTAPNPGATCTVGTQCSSGNCNSGTCQ